MRGFSSCNDTQQLSKKNLNIRKKLRFWKII